MLIECPKLKFQLFIPFIFPIFFQMRTFFISSTGNIEDNNLFKLFRYYFSYLLSGIFLLIIQIRTKLHNKKKLLELEKSDNLLNKSESDPDWINPLNITKESLIKEKQYRNFLFVMLLVLINFISYISKIVLQNIFNDYNNEIIIGKQSIGVFFEIIYLLIFTKIILKTKIIIYKHHFFSLGFMSLNLIILFISFVIHFSTNTIKVAYFYFFSSLFFCLFDVLGKKYLNLFCSSPYQLMLKIGIISSILLIIYDLIIICIKGNSDTSIHGIIIGFYNNLNTLRGFFFVLLDIILCFSWNAGIWLTLYYLTPYHFIISESISEYIYFFIEFFFRENSFKILDIIIYCIVYILNIFLSLILNEMIILNFWGLNKFTKKKIQERERKDTLLSKGNEKELIDYSKNTIKIDDDNYLEISHSVLSVGSLMDNYNDNENDIDF